MMTTELNISEEELLADCVRKQPIIYSKSNVSRDEVEEAWASVVDQLDFVERIGEAKRFWYNLRKKYTKRLLAYNNFSTTGSNEDDRLVEALLEPYSFMRWMDEYMDNGSSKDYSTLSSDTPITSPLSDRKFQPLLDREDSRYDDSRCRSKSVDIMQSGGKITLHKQISNGGKGFSLNTPNCNNSIRNHDVEKVPQSSTRFNQFSFGIKAENTKTKADELFGQMIAEELTQFDEIDKCSIKLEIRKVFLEKLMKQKDLDSVVSAKRNNSLSGSRKDLDSSASPNGITDVSEQVAFAALATLTGDVDQVEEGRQNTSVDSYANTSSATTEF